MRWKLFAGPFWGKLVCDAFCEKGKGNNPNCAWKISSCILTFTYSLDLLSVMFRRPAAIFWPKSSSACTDLFLFDFKNATTSSHRPSSLVFDSVFRFLFFGSGFFVDLVRPCSEPTSMSSSCYHLRHWFVVHLRRHHLLILKYQLFYSYLQHQKNGKKLQMNMRNDGTFLTVLVQ